MNVHIFEEIESNVRSYCRTFPVVFERAQGSFLFAENGKKYVDFFSGAGTINYGHNNGLIKKALVDYINSDGIVHGLDLFTTAKRDFLERFQKVILKPRSLDYKVQFTGPTGTNAVEAALKLARLVKKRSNIVSFTRGYHGLTMGALAVTANASFRNETFINRSNASFLPFDGYFGSDVDTANYLSRFLEDTSSGVDLPAAVILETIQAEGGINVASDVWLRKIESICRDHDVLLIVDDIQVGGGRTGPFFSFEHSGIVPDMVTLSKSISGYGLPMALLLMNRGIDQWKAGEHTGTFRGNNLAFISATKALDYWEDDKFSEEIRKKGEIIHEHMASVRVKYSKLQAQVRGKGMICGFQVAQPSSAQRIVEIAFNNGLVIELAGPENNVLKLLPPLTIEENELCEGLAILEKSVAECL